MQRNSVEVQSPKQWNLIGRSVTGTPPMLSPSSILLSLSSHCPFISARKNPAPLKNATFFVFSNCVSLKLPISGHISTGILP
jgi:hypothetical protein